MMTSTSHSDWPQTDWEPVPLELPLENPYRRRPDPAGGEAEVEEKLPGSHVIEIELRTPRRRFYMPAQWGVA